MASPKYWRWDGVDEEDDDERAARWDLEVKAAEWRGEGRRRGETGVEFARRLADYAIEQREEFDFEQEGIERDHAAAAVARARRRALSGTKGEERAAYWDFEVEAARLRGEEMRRGEDDFDFAARLINSAKVGEKWYFMQGDDYEESMNYALEAVGRERVRRAERDAVATRAVVKREAEARRASLRWMRNESVVMALFRYIERFANEFTTILLQQQSNRLRLSMEQLASAREVDEIDLYCVAWATMYRVPVAGAPIELRSLLVELHAHERFALHRCVAMEHPLIVAGRATMRVPDPATRPVRVDERLRKKLARRRCDVCDLRVPLWRSHFWLCDGCGLRRYCGVDCQRRDWLANRHCDECENL